MSLCEPIRRSHDSRSCSFRGSGQLAFRPMENGHVETVGAKAFQSTSFLFSRLPRPARLALLARARSFLAASIDLGRGRGQRAQDRYQIGVGAHDARCARNGSARGSRHFRGPSSDRGGRWYGRRGHLGETSFRILGVSLGRAITLQRLDLAHLFRRRLVHLQQHLRARSVLVSSLWSFVLLLKLKKMIGSS